MCRISQAASALLRPRAGYGWARGGFIIIVTGATGQLGRAIVERLLSRVPAGQIGVSVRDPDQAENLATRGIRVRRADFGDPPSLAHAFEGASQSSHVPPVVLTAITLRPFSIA